MPIGPSLPPHLAHLSARQPSPEAGPSMRSTTPTAGPGAEESESDDDDYGPALPPHLAAKRIAGPTLPGAGSISPPRIRAAAAPAAAPARLAAAPAFGDDGSDDDDDDIGPRPPGDDEAGQEKSAVEEFLEREKRRAENLEEKEKPKVLKREEWMLVPPEAGVLSSVDPLRKRPSTFNRTNKEAEVDNTVWTETPAEKHQRLADEAAGIKRNKAPKKGEKDETYESRGKRQREEEIRAEVERHNKSSRGESLLDQYKKKGPVEEDDRGIWNHERDMGITGRLMSDKERQTKINEARGLNDRFGHSKKGAFSM